MTVSILAPNPVADRQPGCPTWCQTHLDGEGDLEPVHIGLTPVAGRITLERVRYNTTGDTIYWLVVGHGQDTRTAELTAETLAAINAIVNPT